MIRHYVIIFIAKNCWARPQEIKVCQFKDFRLIDNDQFVVLDISRQKSKTNKRVEKRSSIQHKQDVVRVAKTGSMNGSDTMAESQQGTYDLLFPMTTDPESGQHTSFYEFSPQYEDPRQRVGSNCEQSAIK